MKWLEWIINSTHMSLSKLWELMIDRGSLACCSPRVPKELYMTERLNNSKSSKRHGFDREESERTEAT